MICSNTEGEVEQGPRGRWGPLIVAGGVAVAVLLLVAAMLSREAAQTAPLPATSVPTSPADPAVATINGQPIGRNFWAEAVLMDQVMSGLAGVSAPAPEETLERLINEVLLIQAAPAQQTPTDEEVEARIAALEEAWGVGDEQVVAALAAVGLEREALVRSVTRLLVVQRAQGALEAEGTSIEDWLVREREQAQIVIYRERMQVNFLPVPPTAYPSALPTPTPELSLSSELDFTLERAGGGTFTLLEQLTRGPVVLVFFQRCG